MRRAPQQIITHMIQQTTTKVAPAYDGRTSFFAFEDAIDDWCGIAEGVDLLCETGSRVMPHSTKGYWIESF